ncbi:hypothetical protein BG004_003556 [Podila humilis]|nr:hypothetical protein BG004_003556 [Podila humilis]
MPPPTMSYMHIPGKDQSPESDDLILQVERIHDPAILKRMLIEKEQERQDLASNLDLAARLGLGLQQQLEHVEMESYAKLQSLQDQNLVLQSKANRSKELSTQLAGSEHEIKTLTGHNHFLQRELDSCRRDLKCFRQELDELTEQMTDMGLEMMDAKNKVNSYARRLGEVEQELATTQELNVNLQVQLENALHRQKQTHSSTTQAVKLIQSDLGKVFTESDTMRTTLEELESRQIKCEGKVFEMMTNTREYAQLLEEAQDTIHNLRLESDLEGRVWSRGPQAAIWDDKTGTDPSEEMFGQESFTRKAVLDSQSRAQDLKEQTKNLKSANNQPLLDPELDPELDFGHWTGGGNSLGLELGRDRDPDSELSRLGRGTDLDSPGRRRSHSSPPSSPQYNTLSNELGMEDGSTFGDFASKNATPAEAATENESRLEASSSTTEAAATTATAATGPTEPRPLSPSMIDIDDELGPDTLISTDYSSSSQYFTFTHLPQRLSLSAELHQRLEENNILQNVLTGANLPWSASGQRSPNSIRAEVNRTLQHHLHLAAAMPGSPRIARTGMSSATASASSHVGLEASLKGLHGSSSLASSSTSTASFAGASNNNNNNSNNNANQHHHHHNAATTSPVSNRSRGSIVLENQNTLGLKYLLSATSAADLSNVITKSKAKGSASSVTSTSSTTSSVSSVAGSEKKISIAAVSAMASRRTSSPTHLEFQNKTKSGGGSGSGHATKTTTHQKAPAPWSTSTVAFTASRPEPTSTTTVRRNSNGRESPNTTNRTNRGTTSPGRISPSHGRGASPSGRVSPNKSAGRPVSPSTTQTSNHKTRAATSSTASTGSFGARRASLPSSVGSSS